MVRTMNGSVLKNRASKQKSALIVELVGLAGSGKTTLSRALIQRDDTIRVADDLALRRGKHMRIFASHLPFFLSLLLRCGRTTRWFTWNEMKAMIYLKAWPQILRQQAMHNSSIILLDHGPIFKLATLNAFGPPRLKSPSFEPWWHSNFEQWASVLDMVIWLEAPNKTLLERINRRHQRHVVKAQPERNAYDFLLRYESSYEQILGRLGAYGGPTLLHFDTNQASVEQLIDKVLAACNLNLGGNLPSTS
jgi:shikimate kinase